MPNISYESEEFPEPGQEGAVVYDLKVPAPEVQHKEAEETSASCSIIQRYFQEIRDIVILTPAEEKAVAYRVKQGDAQAREIMIKSNLRLVISVARRYRNCGLPLNDLIEEGNLGLIRAVEKFKPELGFKFSTYAAWWIRQSIVRSIAKHSHLVRLPVNVAEAVNRFFRLLQSLVQKMGRDPSPTEIAAEMGMSPEQVTRILALSQNPISLEHEIGCKEGNSLKDVFSDPMAASPIDIISCNRRQQVIKCLFNHLTPQEQEILSHRFGLENGEPKTLETIGNLFGLTRERIRQIEVNALKKLRRLLFHNNTPLAELL